MEPCEARGTSAQVQGKGETDTDDVSLREQGVTLRPGRCALCDQGLGNVAPDSFRRPGLRVLHLELPAGINDADGWIHRGDLLNRLIAYSTQEQNIHSLHRLRISTRPHLITTDSSRVHRKSLFCVLSPEGVNH